MLHGERVILRAIRRDDLPRLNVFNNDVAYEIEGGGDPWEPQAFERFERTAFDGSGDRDGSRFVIEADGKPIGTCGLFRYDWTARTAEFGIGIGDPEYRGHGYGRDAVRVLMRYAFRLRNLHKVTLRANASNERAIRSYQTVGFVEEGRLRQQAWVDGRYDDVVVMGLLRDEFTD